MLKKYLQPDQTNQSPKEEVEVLHDLFLLSKDVTLTYPVIFSVLKTNSRPQLRKMVFILRSEKHLYIQTVLGKGYIYKGSQLESIA